jgi:hypothetical protein
MLNDLHGGSMGSIILASLGVLWGLTHLASAAMAAEQPDDSVLLPFFVLCASLLWLLRSTVLALEPRLAELEMRLWIGIPMREQLPHTEHWVNMRRTQFLRTRWESTGVLEFAGGLLLLVLAVDGYLESALPTLALAAAIVVPTVLILFVPMTIRLKTLWPFGWAFTRPQRKRFGLDHALGVLPAGALAGLIATDYLPLYGLVAGLAGAALALYAGVRLGRNRLVVLATYFAMTPFLVGWLPWAPFARQLLGTVVLMGAGALVSGVYAFAELQLRIRREPDVRSLVLRKLESLDPAERAMAAWVVGATAARKDFDRLLAPALMQDEWASYEALNSLDMLWGAPAEVRLEWLLEEERQAGRDVPLDRAAQLSAQARSEAHDHARAYRMDVAATASLDPLVRERAELLLGKGWWLWAKEGARLLGMMSSEESRAALARAVESGTPMEAGAAAFGWVLVAPEDAGALARLAEHPRACVRRSALNSVGAVVDGQVDDPDGLAAARAWALPIIERASRHPSVTSRLWAGLVGWRLETADVDRLVRPLLRDPAWAVRGGALIGLYRCQAPDASEIARAMADDERAWIRKQVEIVLEDAEDVAAEDEEAA